MKLTKTKLKQMIREQLEEGLGDAYVNWMNKNFPGEDEPEWDVGRSAPDEPAAPSDEPVAPSGVLKQVAAALPRALSNNKPLLNILQKAEEADLVALLDQLENPYGQKVKHFKASMEEGEDSMDERKLTKPEKEKLKSYEKKVPKEPFKKEYGKEKGEQVYYATMTKQAKEKA